MTKIKKVTPYSMKVRPSKDWIWAEETTDRKPDNSANGPQTDLNPRGLPAAA